ncbi:MAG: M15 family metallopeptidase [Acidimicrobiales bacterium]
MIDQVGKVVARKAKGFNPYAAIVAIARHNPKAAMLIGAMLATGCGTMLLVAISSAQAFMMISQQSSNNAQNRFSLSVNRSAADPEELALGEDESAPVDGAATTDPSNPAGNTANSTAGSAAPQTVAGPTGVVGPDDVVSVNGIRVHHSIADDITRLFAAAEADGIVLSGWGWRDSRTQIRLRKEHCGTTEYAIYRMPSSQCRPPTARPGRSQHERGLAIDFTYNGGSISSHRSPGYKWLNANAATFGLKNLASEPWHWSTTGN